MLSGAPAKNLFSTSPLGSEGDGLDRLDLILRRRFGNCQRLRLKLHLLAWGESLSS